MARFEEMSHRGRVVRGPLADLVELDDGSGGRAVALCHHEEHRADAALSAGLAPVRDFLALPMVDGLARLEHLLNGIFGYAASPDLRTVRELVAVFAEEGGGGERAALELVARAGAILVSAAEAATDRGLQSHGSLDPWRIAVDPAGRVTIFGYGLPSLDGLAFQADERNVPRPDSLRYFPPERLDGEPEDVTSDLYALCLVAAELCAGTPVYDGADLLDQVSAGDAPGRLGHLPPALAAALAPMLAPFADDRPRQRRAWLRQIEEASRQAPGRPLAGLVVEGAAYLSDVEEDLPADWSFAALLGPAPEDPRLPEVREQVAERVAAVLLLADAPPAEPVAEDGPEVSTAIGAAAAARERLAGLVEAVRSAAASPIDTVAAGEELLAALAVARDEVEDAAFAVRRATGEVREAVARLAAERAALQHRAAARAREAVSSAEAALEVLGEDEEAETQVGAARAALRKAEVTRDAATAHRQYERATAHAEQAIARIEVARSERAADEARRAAVAAAVRAARAAADDDGADLSGVDAPEAVAAADDPEGARDAALAEIAERRAAARAARAAEAARRDAERRDRRAAALALLDALPPDPADAAAVAALRARVHASASASGDEASAVLAEVEASVSALRAAWSARAARVEAARAALLAGIAEAERPLGDDAADARFTAGREALAALRAEASAAVDEDALERARGRLASVARDLAAAAEAWREERAASAARAAIEVRAAASAATVADAADDPEVADGLAALARRQEALAALLVESQVAAAGAEIDALLDALAARALAVRTAREAARAAALATERARASEASERAAAAASGRGEAELLRFAAAAAEALEAALGADAPGAAAAAAARAESAALAAEHRLAEIRAEEEEARRARRAVLLEDARALDARGRRHAVDEPGLAAALDAAVRAVEEAGAVADAEAALATVASAVEAAERRAEERRAAAAAERAARAGAARAEGERQVAAIEAALEGLDDPLAVLAREEARDAWATLASATEEPAWEAALQRIRVAASTADEVVASIRAVEAARGRLAEALSAARSAGVAPDDAAVSALLAGLEARVAGLSADADASAVDAVTAEVIAAGPALAEARARAVAAKVEAERAAAERRARVAAARVRADQLAEALDESTLRPEDTEIAALLADLESAIDELAQADDPDAAESLLARVEAGARRVGAAITEREEARRLAERASAVRAARERLERALAALDDALDALPGEPGLREARAAVAVALAGDDLADLEQATAAARGLEAQAREASAARAAAERAARDEALGLADDAIRRAQDSPHLRVRPDLLAALAGARAEVERLPAGEALALARGLEARRGALVLAARADAARDQLAALSSAAARLVGQLPPAVDDLPPALAEAIEAVRGDAEAAGADIDGADPDLVERELSRRAALLGGLESAARAVIGEVAAWRSTRIAAARDRAQAATERASAAWRAAAAIREDASVRACLDEAGQAAGLVASSSDPGEAEWNAALAVAAADRAEEAVGTLREEVRRAGAALSGLRTVRDEVEAALRARTHPDAAAELQRAWARAERAAQRGERGRVEEAGAELRALARRVSVPPPSGAASPPPKPLAERIEQAKRDAAAGRAVQVGPTLSPHEPPDDAGEEQTLRPPGAATRAVSGSAPPAAPPVRTLGSPPPVAASPPAAEAGPDVPRKTSVAELQARLRARVAQRTTPQGEPPAPPPPVSAPTPVSPPPRPPAPPARPAARLPDVPTAPRPVSRPPGAPSPTPRPASPKPTPSSEARTTLMTRAQLEELLAAANEEDDLDEADADDGSDDDVVAFGEEEPPVAPPKPPPRAPGAPTPAAPKPAAPVAPRPPPPPPGLRSAVLQPPPDLDEDAERTTMFRPSDYGADDDDPAEGY